MNLIAESHKFLLGPPGSAKKETSWLVSRQNHKEFIDPPPRLISAIQGPPLAVDEVDFDWDHVLIRIQDAHELLEHDMQKVCLECLNKKINQ